MGRNWTPKYLNICPKCGWKGKRSNQSKKCPKCQFWHPKKVKLPESDNAVTLRKP